MNLYSIPYILYNSGLGPVTPAGLGLNYGYQFDGTKSIDFGNVLDNDGTSAFSISFWTKNIANSEWIITKQSARYGGLEINSDGNRKMGFSLGRTSTDRIACVSVDAIPLNQWNHWVMTYDGSKTVAGVEMYMNDVLQSKTTVRDTFTGSSSNSGNFNIGSLVWSVNNWLDCRLDDVQYYDFVLNSSQVSDIYNNGYVTPPTAGPVHHWKMGEEDTFSTNWNVNDSVGSLNGTSSGMVHADRKLGVAYAMNFDGVDEEILFPSTVGNFSASNPFSISIWCKNLTNTILGKYTGGVGYSLWNNGTLVYFRFNSGGLSQIYADLNGFTNFNHIVIVYNGGGLNDPTNFRFFTNSIETSASMGGTGVTGDINNGDNFRISSSNGFISNGGGDKMELSIYDTELSAKDVNSLYNSGVPVDPRDVSLTPSFFAPLGGKNDIKLKNANFDGVDEHVDFGNVNDLTGFEPFSISFWTTGYNGAGNAQVINKHDGSKGYYLYMNSSNNPHFIMQDGTNTIFVFSSLANDVGHHVLTYDGSGLWTGIKYYINGVSNNVTLVTSNSSISSSISNTSNFYFGSPTNPINGDFMYLSMYNTELSASDVTALYNNGVPIDPRDVSLNPSFFVPLGGPNDTFSTNWTFVDEVGGNNGTSVNMEEADVSFDRYVIVDEINGNNGTSVNMEEADKTSETP